MAVVDVDCDEDRRASRRLHRQDDFARLSAGLQYEDRRVGVAVARLQTLNGAIGSFSSSGTSAYKSPDVRRLLTSAAPTKKNINSPIERRFCRL